MGSLIRRGDEFRIGPIRIPVLTNHDGRCEVIPIYGEVTAVGSITTVDEEDLDRLAQEPGVDVRYASKRQPK